MEIYSDPATHTTEKAFAFLADQIGANDTPVVRYLGSCAASTYQVSCAVELEYPGNGTRSYDIALGVNSVVDVRTARSIEVRGQNINVVNVVVEGFLDLLLKDYVSVFVMVPTGSVSNPIIRSAHYVVRELTNRTL